MHKEEILLFLPDEIIYVEARRKNSIIHITGRASGIVIGLGLDKVTEILPAHLFCRIHRSYLVSLLHIKKMDKLKTRLYYGDNKILPLGPSFIDDLIGRMCVLK